MAKQTRELAKITSSANSTSLTRKVEAIHPIAFYMPVSMAKALRHVHTPADALECKTDSIATLCRVNGLEKVEANLSVHLVSLQASLGVKNKLDEAQCDEIAAEIVDQFKQLTMADIHVIFRRVKNGEFGELYERISRPKVITWFREYIKERVQVAMERNESEAGKHWVGNDTRTGRPIRIGDELVNQKSSIKNRK